MEVKTSHLAQSYSITKWHNLQTYNTENFKTNQIRKLNKYEVTLSGKQGKKHIGRLNRFELVYITIPPGTNL